MPKFGEPSPQGETLTDIDLRLLDELPRLAIGLIEERPENAHFKENPDDPVEHDAVWHQFGIITHTRKFAEFYRTEAQEYFQKWGVAESITAKLSTPIDGKTKEELLRISIPLHDLGKFARGFKEKNGKMEPDYKGHEAKSESIIRENPEVKGLLQTYGLTEAQIDYIARCAGLHYELGKMRDEAKKSALGFTIAFAQSEECRQACQEIASGFPEFQTEIGILFLCDNLAKTDVRIEAETDEEIENQSAQIERALQTRGLNPKLIGGVKQRPVNIAIAKEYLGQVK